MRIARHALVALLLPGIAVASDPAAAERQYRVARRLLAERSPDAEAALQQVVALDPEGSLADDALVDLAIARGACGWPEDTGSVTPERRRTIEDALSSAVRGPSADRAAEAAFRAALLALEPQAGYDTAAARRGFLAVAARPDASEWGARARYAVGWIDAAAGDLEGARGTWTRVALDHPGTAASHRALVGLATLDLRASRFAEAARLLQGAIESEGSDPAAMALRDLAVRRAIESDRDAWDPRGSRTAIPVEGVREVSGIAATLDGRVWVADARRGEVVEAAPEGTLRRHGLFDDLRAVTTDARGRAYVAAGTAVYRLDAAGPTTLVDLGRSGPATALAVDGGFAVYAADRRGERVLRIAAGASTAETWWEAGDARIAALAWDHTRLLVADGRSGEIFAVERDGRRGATLSAGDGRRADALAVDPSGRFVVCDGRARRITLHDVDGEPLDDLAVAEAGLGKPSGCALGPDGALWTFDAQNGALVRFP